MKTFTATIIPTDLQVPAGSQAQGPYRWTLGGPSGQNLDTTDPTATFTVEAGDYTLTVQAFAADGVTPYGGPSRAASFTVTEDTVTVNVVTDGEITITF